MLIRTTAVIVIAALAGSALAQPAVLIRFPNGSNQIQVSPGVAVLVSMYATGLPNQGTNIPWTTPPGTGQNGHYAGFLSVFMDLQANGGEWSTPIIPGGMGYQTPPFGSAGAPGSSGVTGISIGVGFNPPVTGNQFLLWQGTVTAGTTDIQMNTLLRAQGNPPRTGFELALSGIGELNVSHFVSVANASALITVPGPAPLAALAGAIALVPRRRRGGGCA